ncbi:unnamed protein product [Schistosoma turkestanicum]|nr:unnamed protein product [Schistosoma turkestanicum]
MKFNSIITMNQLLSVLCLFTYVNAGLLNGMSTDGLITIDTTNSEPEIETSVTSPVGTESVDTTVVTTTVDKHKEGTANLDSIGFTGPITTTTITERTTTTASTASDVSSTEASVTLTSTNSASITESSPSESETATSSPSESESTTSSPSESETATSSPIESESTTSSDIVSSPLATDIDITPTEIIVQTTSGDLENQTESTPTVTSDSNHTETEMPESSTENLDNQTEAVKTIEKLTSSLIFAVGNVCEEFAISANTHSTESTSEDLENQTQSTINSETSSSIVVTPSVHENGTEVMYTNITNVPESTSEIVTVPVETTLASRMYQSRLMELVKNLCTQYTTYTNNNVNEITTAPTEITNTTESEIKSTENETQSVSTDNINTESTNETLSTTQKPTDANLHFYDIRIPNKKEKKCKPKKSDDEEECSTDSENGGNSTDGSDSDED